MRNGKKEEKYICTHMGVAIRKEYLERSVDPQLNSSINDCGDHYNS